MFRKIGILGAARSGIAAAQKALHHGYEVFISDSNNIEKQILSFCNHETGGHTEKLLEMDVLIVSPGIPLNIPILEKAKDRGIKIMSEIEFAYQHTHKDTKIIAVTGSNGKSTTVSLINHLLVCNGFNTVLAGNIGDAYSSFDIENKKDFIVLEVSSFQLELIHTFKPDVAVILNISPDHLDRYKSYEDYAKAKFNIFKNMDVDVINEQFPIIAFSPQYNTARAWECGEEVNSSVAINAVSPFVDMSDIYDHVSTFKPLNHRLEPVATINGVEYINDSKATNTGSVIYALKILNKPIHLILGGSDKGEDFSVLIEPMKDKVKRLYLIGNTAKKLYELLKNDYICEIYNDFEDVINNTKLHAKEGEVVLLSPACASFDWFKNYEERGDKFKEILCVPTASRR